MQTREEKIAILKKINSLTELEVRNPLWEQADRWDCANRWPRCIFDSDFQIRIKPKTLTRTITTPVPVSLEWVRSNPNGAAYYMSNSNTSFNASDASRNTIEAGLVFYTDEDAAAALKAFMESMN